MSPKDKLNRNPITRARRSRAPGEFDLIERLTAGRRLSSRTLLGPGDDCAIRRGSHRAKLFTIDSVVEGVHFELHWGTAEQLGARALEVNMSDIAAMGGTPTACVVNLAIRPGLDTRFFDELYSGLHKSARAAAVDVVGGNITTAKELAITIAMLGDAPPHPLRRDAARVGDEIFVTGTLGDAAVGWRLLAGRLKTRAGAARRQLVARALSPSARIAAGRALAKIRPSPAAIDISDGLLQDMGHIAARSGVGAELARNAIPVSEAYRTVMRGDLSLALGGGEDYELLFCARPGYSERELAGRLGVAVTRIGKIVRGSGVRLVGAGGELVVQRGDAGWDQLRHAR